MTELPPNDKNDIPQKNRPIVKLMILARQITLGVALIVFTLTSQLYAQADNQHLWKFGKQELIDGTNKFSIQLEKTQPGIQGQNENVKITLDAENKELEYDPHGGFGELIYFKVDNAGDLNKLKLLLENFVVNLVERRANTQLPSISFSTGNYNVSCHDVFRMRNSAQADLYSGVIQLESIDGVDSEFIRRPDGFNAGTITIAEPTALLFAINSFSEIAIQMKQAADDARDADEKARKVIQDKVKAYLGTASGLALGVKINNLFTNVIALNKKEKQVLVDAETEMNKILKTPGADPSDAVNQYTFLATNYKDSDQLKEMREELGRLAAKFQSECGISYDEAWESGGKDLIEHGSNSQIQQTSQPNLPSGRTTSIPTNSAQQSDSVEPAVYFGAVDGRSAYNQGYPYPTDDELDSKGRRLSANMEFTKPGGRQDFIQGYKEGYKYGWDEAKDGK